MPIKWPPFRQNWGSSILVPSQLITFPPGWNVIPSSRQPTTLANVSFPDPGRQFVITLDYYAPIEPLLINAHFAIAEIKWGSGGVQHTAYVDFKNGAIINVSASFIRVSVWSLHFATVVQAKLSASIALGPIAKNNSAQRTMFSNPATIVPGGTGTILIPPFANRFSLFGISTGAPVLRPPPVTVVGSNGATILVSGANSEIKDIPIGLVTKTLEITNNGLDDMEQCSAVFTLDI